MPSRDSAERAPPPLSRRRPPQPGIERDVTAIVAAMPTLRFDLDKNLILGDPYNKTLPRLRPRQAALDACLRRLGARALRKPPTSLDIGIRRNGKLDRAVLYGDDTARAQTCILRILRRVRFSPGRKRVGLIKIKSTGPPPPIRDPRVAAMTWRSTSGGFEVAMRAEREQDALGVFRVKLTAKVTARRKRRGIGPGSLRFNVRNVTAGGRSQNSFSLQRSTKVAKCLSPGRSATLTRRVRDVPERGGRLELSVYLLGGDCSTGEGRHEIAMVFLDWTRGETPILYVAPSWYQPR